MSLFGPELLGPSLSMADGDAPPAPPAWDGYNTRLPPQTLGSALQYIPVEFEGSGSFTITPPSRPLAELRLSGTGDISLGDGYHDGQSLHLLVSQTAGTSTFQPSSNLLLPLPWNPGPGEVLHLLWNARLHAWIPSTVTGGGGVPASRAINTVDSIQGGGNLTADRTLNLVGDATTPGNNKLYGTNGAGDRGWYNQPVGTVTSVDGSGGTTGLNVTGGPITSAGTLTLGGTLTEANGGTGETSYTNGQLLIGNGTGLTKNTLTAGTATSISNASGSITVNTTLGTTGTSAAAGNDTRIVNAVQTSRNINTTNSVTGGGNLTADRTITLVGDTAAPGNSKLYGTNGSGTRGWYDIPPAGTVTSVGVSGGTTGLTTSGGPVTTSGTITLSGTLTEANGGTGETSYTNGQILIGNGTGLTKSTITAGTATSITNGAGSITINTTLGTTAGTAAAGNDTRIVNAVQTSRNINTQHSVTGGGNLTADRTLNLVGDTASPGNSKLYGTNGSGTRGWYDIPPAGTVTSVDVSGGTTGLTYSGGPITSSGTITMAGTLTEANGGTGETSYTNGQLLIGNGTGLTKNNLLAGTATSITNGSGTITINTTIGTTGTSAAAGNDTRIVNAVQTSRNINTQHSITGGGNLTADRTLNLVNDTASPGNHKRYGTNGSGTRGWYDGVNGSGAAGKVTYWSDANTLSHNNNFSWDNGNTRLGIGLTTPLDTLHVNGSIGLSGGNRSINNRDASSLSLGTNNMERLLISAAGNIGLGVGDANVDDAPVMIVNRARIRAGSSFDAPTFEFTPLAIGSPSQIYNTNRSAMRFGVSSLTSSADEAFRVVPQGTLAGHGAYVAVNKTAADYPLDVLGAIGIEDPLKQGSLIFHDVGGRVRALGAQPLDLETNDESRIHITPTGLIGFSTKDPVDDPSGLVSGVTLGLRSGDVAAVYSIGSDASPLAQWAAATTGGGGEMLTALYTNSTMRWLIGSGTPVERMRLTSAGVLAITPSTGAGTLTLNGTGGTIGTSAAGPINIIQNSVSKFAVSTDGCVGINASPIDVGTTFSLSIGTRAGDIQAAYRSYVGSTQVAYWQTSLTESIFGSVSAIPLSLRTSNVERLRLQSDNNHSMTGNFTVSLESKGRTHSSSGTQSSTVNANLTVDAATVQFVRWQAGFTTSRTLNISNVTTGRSIKIYVRNTGGVAVGITIRASTTAASHNLVNCSHNFNTTSVSSATLPASTGTATITVWNAAGFMCGQIG